MEGVIEEKEEEIGRKLGRVVMCPVARGTVPDWNKLASGPDPANSQ